MATSPPVDAAQAADPITYQVVRHRLWAIGDEMALSLIRTAGNPSIVEARDFMIGLYTADGDVALAGWGINRHVPCVGRACKVILERFPRESIHEGDVFLLNDPYLAAIHQPDVYVIAPVHFEGELVGWTANFTHLPDIGGIDPGSSPRAREVTQEGLRVPGLKIVDRGEVRQDVWDTLLNMTREPEMNALQLKAQLAANNTGRAKLGALLRKVGPARYQTIVAQMIAESEQSLRYRLRQLPDGIWRAREYFDSADSVYTIQLAMTKQGDTLHFDYTGTSEQAPNFINVTYWGAFGGVFSSVSNLLGYELPWNEGLLRPLRVTIPEGTILNCRYPAPVSMGTIAGSRMAQVAAWSAIAGMLAMSERYADEVSAHWAISATGVRITGQNRQNRFFVLTPFAEAGGSGARRFADGIDSGGPSTNTNCTNVETLERDAPVLYLFRREMPDSGGPGTMRGGVGLESAFTAYKAPTGYVTGVLHASGHEPAQSHGLFGGLPGCNTTFALHGAAALPEQLATAPPATREALPGEARPLPAQGLADVNAASALYAHADGGGGLGDPLLRPAECVLDDVLAGLVSVEQARARYGVVLAGERVDAAATAALRHELRTGRLGHAPTARVAEPPPGAAVDPIMLRIDAARGVVECGACGQTVGDVRANWKLRAVEQVEPLRALGPLFTSTRFVLRSYCCPACGTALDAEMTLPDDPPLHSYSPP
ncbi:MAG TPA: hydantoinase B/oxoprolinase family protein [Chloroflexota bacterium]|jgi:N-methylhydantoinase B